MRIKRYRQFKKKIGFFEKHFGFRKPHRIIVDSTFAQAALTARINLKEQLPRFFGSEITLLVSKCILHEAKNLGSQLKGAVKILGELSPWGCGHIHPIPASDCITHLIGETNKNHLFLASQDKILKQSLIKKVLPLLHITHQTIQFESPSDYILQEVQIKNIEKMKSEIEQPRLSKFSKRNRRKRKNPNPLSILRPKNKGVSKSKKTNQHHTLDQMLEKIKNIRVS